MIIVRVDPALLYAFAQLNEGPQFKADELRCRVVQATTDEGYSCEGQVLEVYGVPSDANWHAYMEETYGQGPHDVTFYRNSFNTEESSPKLNQRVTQYLLRKVQQELQRRKHSYEELASMLTSLGVK